MAIPPLDPTEWGVPIVSFFPSHPLSDSRTLPVLPAQPDPPNPSPSPDTVVYGVVGTGVALVVLAVLVVAVLIGKRKRVTAKLWRPNSPSDASPGEVGGGATPTGTSGATDSGDAAL